MPEWVIVLVAALGGGLAATLLRLRHERAAELRGRMLEAADDFVEAYTAARDATAAARTQVASFDSLAGEDVPEALRQQWRERRDAAISSATDACAALSRRRPRIGLLYGVHSPPDRSAFLAHVNLTTVMHSLTRKTDELTAQVDDAWRQADRHLEAFGRRAREAILASPWSVRPIVARARIWRRRLKKRKRARDL